MFLHRTLRDRFRCDKMEQRYQMHVGWSKDSIAAISSPTVPRILEEFGDRAVLRSIPSPKVQRFVPCMEICRAHTERG